MLGIVAGYSKHSINVSLNYVCVCLQWHGNSLSSDGQPMKVLQ